MNVTLAQTYQTSNSDIINRAVACYKMGLRLYNRQLMSFQTEVFRIINFLDDIKYYSDVVDVCNIVDKSPNEIPEDHNSEFIYQIRTIRKKYKISTESETL